MNERAARLLVFCDLGTENQLHEQDLVRCRLKRLAPLFDDVRADVETVLPKKIGKTDFIQTFVDHGCLQLFCAESHVSLLLEKSKS